MKSDAIADMIKHFLYPSSLMVSSEPCEITTILGSCVAVCLFDPVLLMGGINHFMLPLWNGTGLASPKYGNIAIEKLIEKLKQQGCRTGKLQAKIFGGGEVISNHGQQVSIGTRNIEIAKVMLKEAGIPIKSYSLGGKYGRKIIFNTGTGEVKQFFIRQQL